MLNWRRILLDNLQTCGGRSGGREEINLWKIHPLTQFYFYFLKGFIQVSISGLNETQKGRKGLELDMPMRDGEESANANRQRDSPRLNK